MSKKESKDASFLFLYLCKFLRILNVKIKVETFYRREYFEECEIFSAHLSLSFYVMRNSCDFCASRLYEWLLFYGL